MMRRFSSAASNIGIVGAASKSKSVDASLLPFVDVSTHFSSVTPIRHGFGRVLVLNSPRLDVDSIAAIRTHLEEWDGDADVKVIALVKRASVPVFCGGLQVQFDAQWSDALEHASLLSHQIATLNTPVVSIMDGPTHGLGASLSLHTPFRISTQNTISSFKEGPGGIGLLLPGTAFALRHLLLDDSQLPGSPLAKWLAVVGDPLKGLENVLTGVATHHVPMERISPLVTKLCETKSSDLRVLDMVIEEFAASSPSVDDWANWSVGEEPMEVVYRCFRHNSLAEIVAALKKENTPWSNKILSQMSRNCPTVMELNIEAVNLALEPQDLLSSFKNDLSMLRGVEDSKDFQSALALESSLRENENPVDALRPEVVLDPKLLNRDTWLASELEGATTPSTAPSTETPTPTWSETLETHITKTSSASKRKSWLKTGQYLQNKSEEIDATKQSIDGATSIWINRTLTSYPHRTATSLPHVEDLAKVVKGEAKNSGDMALTQDEVLTYFANNWNTFLDEERDLSSISASPVENWRLEDSGAGELKREDERTVKFFPSKYYDLAMDFDPNVSGVDGEERYSTKRKEKWGLRQRIDFLVAEKCKVGDGGYLQWK